MRIVDLTLATRGTSDDDSVATLRELTIEQSDGTSYTGMVYDFAHDSMIGTYIDFPGHIKETDDGLDAANYPLEQLYRVDAAVVHLDKPDASGPISAQELADACTSTEGIGGLVLNALGSRRFDEVQPRSIYPDSSALDWIVEMGVHLFVSDVYESKGLHGVFKTLFGAGISTVCCPVNLHLLKTSHVKLTALPIRVPGVTQIPCRLVAELV